MGNSIEDKNWSGSNDSLSKVMATTTTAAQVMDIQRYRILQQADEGPAGEEQRRVVFN